MEFVGKECSRTLNIGLISETQEQLKRILQIPCTSLMFLAAVVYGDTESDVGEGARNIYYRAVDVDQRKGKYICTKEEYENLCRAREIPNDADTILTGETVVIIVRDGDIVGIC